MSAEENITREEFQKLKHEITSLEERINALDFRISSLLDIVTTISQGVSTYSDKTTKCISDLKDIVSILVERSQK